MVIGLHPIVKKALISELAYCKEHPDYFVEKYCHIEDKDTEEIIIPFDLWPAQREALLSIHEHRLNIILKARQLGITWLSLSYAAYVLVTSPGSTVVALSRTEDEAKELVRRISVILGNMPQLVRDMEWGGAVWSSNSLMATVRHETGLESVLKAFPSSLGASRSFTANLVLLDEWAFQQFAREIWESAYPTINRPTGGKVIGLSTIKRGTLFEEIWTADNNFNKVFIPWGADPRRTPDWYEETKKALGDSVTGEYPATPEEALTIPGGAFFPEMRAHVHFIGYVPEGVARRYISIDYGLDALAALWYVIGKDGNATVYRELYKSGLIVSEAAQAIHDCMGDDPVDVIFAPPDLWNKNRDTGRSTAEIFGSCGIYLTQVSNDRKQGWLDVKEWLLPVERRNEHTGETQVISRLRILEGAAPNLWRCLLAIQKDEKKPNDCATEPHELTHLPDSLRYFCSGRPCAPKIKEKPKPKPYDPLSTPPPRHRGNFHF